MDKFVRTSSPNRGSIMFFDQNFHFFLNLENSHDWVLMDKFVRTRPQNPMMGFSLMLEIICTSSVDVQRSFLFHFWQKNQAKRSR